MDPAPACAGSPLAGDGSESALLRRRPKELTSPVQLMVEGADAWGFWTGVSRRCGLGPIQIHDFGGVRQLGKYLQAVRQTPGFDTVVRTVVIGRDAESDAQAALQSVQTAMRAAGLPVPAGPLALEGDTPRVAIMIWPAPTQPAGSRVWQGSGVLEDLCLACVPPPGLRCADEFLRCVEDAGGKLKKRHKSRLQAYLAGTQHAGLALRDATADGAWNLDSAALTPFVGLLRLAVAESSILVPAD
ncbi:MAG: hypothetical protein FJX72_16205 [Armatimonadetes bacterium]|nr:hypothetical protein [Armatimonadota bacterium]